MRILLVNKFSHPVGGVEAHAFLVKRTLESLVTPSCLSRCSPENLETPYDKYFVPPVASSGVAAPPPPARPTRAARLGFATVRRIRQVVREQQMNIAHVLHAYHHWGWRFLSSCGGCEVPTVLSLHDYRSSCPNYRFFTDRDRTICTRCMDHKSGFLWAPAVTRCWDGSATAG